MKFYFEFETDEQNIIDDFCTYITADLGLYSSDAGYTAGAIRNIILDGEIYKSVRDLP